MKKEEIILIIGIILCLIWLGSLIFAEGKKRKNVLIAGIIIDIILIVVSRNLSMLLVGLFGGLACGLIPNFGRSIRKYDIAVKEMKSVKNWTVASVIFFIMIFMIMAISYPELEVDFSGIFK